MNEKKAYEAAEIRVVLLDSDLLITSANSLAEDGWDFFDFKDL